MKYLITRLCALFALACFSSNSSADLPNTNQPAPGTLLSHVGAQMGRLAVIEILGDYVVTIPEMPSSPPNSDFIVRAWDISDPRNPREVGRFGTTDHPFLAHGAVKRNNELYIGGPWNGNNAIRLNADGTLSHARWTGPDFHYNKSGLMHPWSAADWWSYGDVGGTGWLALNGQQTASWDHLRNTGVIGFAAFMGNLMLYGADQSRTGMASYDVSNPSSPQLLDVLTLPARHPSINAEWGLGGYWNEISHHYMVFPRREGNPGIQVVDFSDPNNLRMHCDFLVKDPKFGLGSGASGDMAHADPMYVGFQDEYAFSERFKLNLKECRVELALDELRAKVETSQYARPIGNLVLTGGMENWQINSNSAGMGIWVHQSAVDNRAPYVGYHIPKANQTNYPVMAPISLMIPETLRSETIRVGDTLKLTEVGGGAVAIDYILSHTGMLTVDPLQNLKPNTTYEVQLENIEDAVRNKMARYTFRFSTGPTIAGGGTPTPSSSSSSVRSASSSVSSSSVAVSSVRSSVSSSSRSSSSSVRSSSSSVRSSSSSSVAPPPAPNVAPRIDSVGSSPRSNIVAGDTVFFDVLAMDPDGDTIEYRFRVQNITEYTAWSRSNSFSYSFPQAGSYTVNVQARDSRGAQTAAVATVNVLEKVVDVVARPASGPIAVSELDEAVWVVDPDNNLLTRIDSLDLENHGEFATGKKPKGVAVASDGSVWVTVQDSDQVEVFDSRGRVLARLGTGYGSAPSGVVIDQERNLAYVSLYGKGEVLRFDTNTRTQTGRLAVAPTVSALALSVDGSRLLAARFISGELYGEVWDINTSTMALRRTIRLYPHLADDTLTNGHGLPNYLSSMVINSEGTRAYLVGKKDNVARGLLNKNEDLDDDNTIRTIAMTLDLQTGRELREQRIDFDNADSPSAVALAPNENYLFVAMQGRNQVFVVSINGETQQLMSVVTQFTTGLAPQGVALDAENSRLFVKNFMSRDVTAIDLSDFLSGGVINPTRVTIPSASIERLTPAVLHGKQLFYNAADGIQGEGLTGRMSAEGYISCASCHFDGGHDGRTYDFTGRGEGLRNNISLRGRGGARFGAMHWSGNFDEVQDFENDIRGAFRGTGLMTNADFAAAEHPMGSPKAGRSADLDALAAYVSSLGKESLPKSPHRSASGSLTADASAGQTIFNNLDCASCHRGKAFTDGALHDVGTLRTYSGKRLNGELSGIKTPSLLGLFDSAPYLHDGSAASLERVFELAGGTVYQAESLPLAGGASLVNAQNFSHLRDGAGVRLTSTGSVTLNATSGAGTANIRLRVGSTASGTRLALHINGGSRSLTLPQLDRVDNQDVSFTEVSANVQLRSGSNTIRIGLASGSSVILDDITLSTPADLAKARVHTQVGSLSATNRQQLLAYLRQIDQQNAPADSEAVILGATTGSSSSASSSSSSRASSVSSSSVRSSSSSVRSSSSSVRSSSSSVRSSSSSVRSSSSSSARSSVSAAPAQCNWYGTLYALCKVPAPEGWGWENNATCVNLDVCQTLGSPYGPVVSSAVISSSSSVRSASSSARSSSSSAAPARCNWQGTVYALCKVPAPEGWGWENNATCVNLDVCQRQRSSRYGVISN